MTRSEITRKYNDKMIKQYSLGLNKKTDADIIEKLESVQSKMGYIKDLIRKDITHNDNQ